MQEQVRYPGWWKRPLSELSGGSALPKVLGLALIGNRHRIWKVPDLHSTNIFHIDDESKNVAMFSHNARGGGTDVTGECITLGSALTITLVTT